MVNAGLSHAARDNSPAYQCPVRACFFFATSPQGSLWLIPNPYLTILAILKGVLLSGTDPSHGLVKELKPKAEEFARISKQFDQIRRGNYIETLRCFEQKPILGQLVRSPVLTFGVPPLMGG